MPTELETFRDYCRKMAAADHAETCGKSVQRGTYSTWTQWVRPAPDCDGCLSRADRELFTRLADEVDAYLTDDDDVALWEEIR